MRVLVTGGAGFIGSHLCEKLLSLEHEVVCADNLITGSIKNIVALNDNSRFTFIDQDINLPFSQDIGKFDLIYHLACPASPVDYKEIPLQTLWVSAAGTKNMLEMAAKQDAGIVVASTSEVYGDPLEHPQKESYWGNVNPIGERSCYNEGKRFAESLAINYWKHFRFNLKIVRIFNTYGPKMRKYDGRVIPEFIMRALADEPLRVNGNGLQTRSFCYIDDMVQGLIDVMKSPKDFTGPVNLGNTEEITMKFLAEKIVALTGSTSLISFTPLPEDDPLHRQPDISLAHAKFNFEPKINLEEGLQRTISFLKNS